ncbi:MAG: aminoacyl-tRNA hydrolase [Burkholderiales bacterium]
MKLIVGLGNPGREYEHTRHNVGFQVAEELARRYRVTLKHHAKWKARAAKIAEIGDGVWLAEPTTFMNLSGWAVREIADFHKLSPSDVLVVVDDADLPLGRLRLRTSGSAGGHNGLKSVIQELGTAEFPRLRVGVGRQAGELKNHVLGRFSVDEKARIDAAVERAADAAELFAKESILAAMNRFNAAQVDEDQA